MKGRYNGVTMRLRYLFPKNELGKIASLSKEAQRRLEWMDWYAGHGKNARLTCRHFGISPDTFYRWKRRFNPKNLRTLEDDKRTRRPRWLREMTTSPEDILRVIKIRKEDPEKSRYEIQEELRREGISLGTTTIQKIINRHASLLNTQHQRKVRTRRKRSIAPIKAARELKERSLGSLIQLDTKHLSVLNKRFYLFAAVDCKSRFG
jgi:transposase